ncbi:MAG: hypothetical protein ABEJ57_06290 [Halobacteriaceae archaeon]
MLELSRTTGCTHWPTVRESPTYGERAAVGRDPHMPGRSVNTGATDHRTTGSDPFPRLVGTDTHRTVAAGTAIVEEVSA